MSQSHLSQAEPTLRRASALPSPWTASDMKFFPNSSVVSDVIPSANYGDRRGGRVPDMIVLHYTGMTDAEVAIRRLTVAGTEVSAHYIVREDGRIIQSVPEIAARLARWRFDMGRGERRQHLLDRRRDRQRRPRLRPARLSAPANRRGDRAVQGHHDPPQHPARAGARPFRRLAGPQAGSGREVSVAAARRLRCRPVRAAREDRAGRGP